MRRLFALVAAVILVDMTFYSALVPLLPDYVDRLGLSKSEAGILSASYAAGTLVAALPSGLLAARVGVRETMLLGLALLSLASLAFAFAESIVALDAARFVQGIGSACSWAGGLAWLLTAAPRERRGELIGAALSAAIVGFLIGPALGAVATVTAPEPVFAAVAAVAAGLAVWVLAAPKPASSPPADLRTVAAAMASGPVLIAFWLVALPSILSGALNVLVPLHFDELGAGGVAVGTAFLVTAAIEAVVSPAIGRVSDRRGRGTPIRAGLIVSGLAALALPLPSDAVLLGAVLVAAVLAMSLIWTPAMALLSDETEACGVDLAFAVALVNLAWAGGQVLGGSAVSRFAETTSDAAGYGIVAALFAATAAVVVMRPRTA